MAPRVVLAMSGGVDSSASALLLKNQGYEVIGLFMRSGATTGSASLPVIHPPTHRQGCCSESDAADARRVADALDIPFHALNFEQDFGRIKDYFSDEYLAGRTPNPCVMCNNWLKFGRLWEFAQQVGARHIASGHYARIVHGENRPALERGRDHTKDQSYVLFGIDRDLLNQIVFPVGDRTKTEIRGLSRDAGLRVGDKPDSQEICFIPDNNYTGFIERYRGKPLTAGEFVDTSGKVVGEHNGYEKFTVGQRKGLGVTFGSPRYVVRIEPKTRRVVIGRHSDLARFELQAERCNWLVDDPPLRFRATVKIRYRHMPAPAEVERLEENRFRARFDKPEYGVAPGQAAVVYQGDRLLGGGWIMS